MKTTAKLLSILNLFRFQSRLINNKDIVKEEKQLDRKYRLYCTPSMTENEIKDIHSVLGLCIGLNHVSWTRIETAENKVTDFNYVTLPQNTFKMDLNDVSRVALQTINTLPPADRYVMENLNKNVRGNSGSLQLAITATRVQLISMLVALLNYFYSKNNDLSSSVIFLKPRLYARLFDILVGLEVVSSENIVTNILSGGTIENFTPVKCDHKILSFFNGQNEVNKEILGHSLLITLSFIELIVHQNKECFKILTESKKKLNKLNIFEKSKIKTRSFI